MQVSSPDTVLGKLPATVGDVTLSWESDQLQVYDATSDATHPVPYTFGVAPLQQYLVDVGNGKLQTLRASWDSRTASQGGQRWFEQFEHETLAPGDVLHWQGIAQNWNSMCADCHSTGVRKQFDAVAQTFNTEYAELSVGCEACHGPGSNHAERPSLALPGAVALRGSEQVDVCAPCHARRSQIAEGFTAGAPLLDYYVPELLNPPLYQADGGIDDEVYVYGSFTSSRMYQQGVICSDCHKPHSAELRVEGNGVCEQCHSPAGNPRFATLAPKAYATPAHMGDGQSCVSCHMPSKTYMGVDLRHDHGFRRPPGADTAATTEGPTDRLDHARIWAQSGTTPTTPVEQALLQLANDATRPPLQRATSLSRISRSSFGTQKAIEQATRDGAPMLRLTSVQLLQQLSPGRQRGALKRLLNDEIHAVRAAAAAYALTLDETQRRSLGDAFNRALAEYVAAQELNQERPEANVNLAMVASGRGDEASAERYLQQALAITPAFIPALLNYADWWRRQGKDAQAEPYLRRAIEAGIPSAEAQYAYALWLVRQGQRELALLHLRAAYEIAPQEGQWLYAYVVGLHSLGQSEAALALLRRVAKQPVYGEALMFLHATIARDLSQFTNTIGGETRAALQAEAAEVATALVQLAPSNATYQQLRASLTTAP